MIAIESEQFRLLRDSKDQKHVRYLQYHRFVSSDKSSKGLSLKPMLLASTYTLLAAYPICHIMLSN